MEKTNVMRILDARGVPYTAHFYDPALTDGREVASAVGKTCDETFKTLVTTAGNGRYYVFLVPVSGALDLKKAAKAAHEKRIEMLPQKELLPLTGYVHGGCSPLGMKKVFPTAIDETAQLFSTVCCSAGKRGAQIELAPDALLAAADAAYADLTEE